jgi:hypothetical protein
MSAHDHIEVHVQARLVLIGGYQDPKEDQLVEWLKYKLKTCLARWEKTVYHHHPQPPRSKYDVAPGNPER